MCEECEAAHEASRESGACHKRFDSLKCAFCAARLIQTIKRAAKSRAEATERCKAALAMSVAAGLDEKEIRRLEGAGSMALKPREEKKGKKK